MIINHHQSSTFSQHQSVIIHHQSSTISAGLTPLLPGNILTTMSLSAMLVLDPEGGKKRQRRTVGAISGIHHRSKGH
jgi:adenylate kinase